MPSPRHFLTPFSLRTKSTSQISPSISQQIVRKQSSHYHPNFFASLTLKAISRNKYNTLKDVLKELWNTMLPSQVVLNVCISLYFSNSHSILTSFCQVTKHLHSQKALSGVAVLFKSFMRLFWPFKDYTSSATLLSANQ